MLLKPKDQARPKRRRLLAKITKDGRVIESLIQYRKTKQKMWEAQGGYCAKCTRYMSHPSCSHRHHPGGRGLGGSKRDDSKTVLWCWKCHTEEHEAQRQVRR